MKPNTPHAVITTAPSLVSGYHFWSTAMLPSTLANEITCLLGDATVTNTEHPSMRVAIHRLLVFQYEAMVYGKIVTRESLSQSHPHALTESH
jgi:hypothetical protein